MTARDRADRIDAIVASRIRGIGWARIAAEHKITERHARRLYTERRAEARARPAPDPVALVQELLDGYDAAIEDLALLARDAPNDAVRLGAINSRVKAVTARTELLMVVGALPEDLGDIRLTLDADLFTERVFGVLKRAGLPQAVWDELEEVLMVKPPPSPFLVAA